MDDWRGTSWPHVRCLSVSSGQPLRQVPSMYPCVCMPWAVTRGHTDAVAIHRLTVSEDGESVVQAGVRYLQCTAVGNLSSQRSAIRHLGTVPPIKSASHAHYGLPMHSLFCRVCDVFAACWLRDLNLWSFALRIVQRVQFSIFGEVSFLFMNLDGTRRRTAMMSTLWPWQLTFSFWIFIAYKCSILFPRFKLIRHFRSYVTFLFWAYFTRPLPSRAKQAVHYKDRLHRFQASLPQAASSTSEWRMITRSDSAVIMGPKYQDSRLTNMVFGLRSTHSCGGRGQRASRGQKTKSTFIRL